MGSGVLPLLFLLGLGLSAPAPSASALAPLPVFEFSGNLDSKEDHYGLGLAIGRKFSSEIALRLSSTPQLYSRLVPYYRSEGRAAYEAFVNENGRVFPLYIAELHGMADGAEVPFDALFINNLNEEFTAAFPSGVNKSSNIDHCSDYVVCSMPSRECLVGHNEDNGAESINRTFLLKTSTFTAFTYMGDLPSGAYGFNKKGFGFTLNWLGPQRGVVGLGRGFISRSLLDASSLEDGIFRATVSGQSTGHNYQLFEAGKGVVNIELAPDGGGPAKAVAFSMRNLTGAAPRFHANQYTSLTVDQFISNSSIHRMERVHNLPVPTNATSILSILGDQEDRSYPIFHDDVSHERGDLADWTLSTVLFDVRRGVMTIFRGNPRQGIIEHKENIFN